MIRTVRILPTLAGCLTLLSAPRSDATTSAAPNAPPGWHTAAPRDEVRPAFAYEPSRGPSGQGAFVVQADGREGLDGFWRQTFTVRGGQYYQFRAFRRLHRVASQRRSAVVRLLWQDDRGRLVLRDEPPMTNFLKGFTPCR